MKRKKFTCGKAPISNKSLRLFHFCCSVRNFQAWKSGPIMTDRMMTKLENSKSLKYLLPTKPMMGGRKTIKTDARNAIPQFEPKPSQPQSLLQETQYW